MKGPLDKLIKDALPGLIGTYRHLHAHPELFYREEKTAARLAKELRSLGYAVTEKVGKYADARWKAYGVVAVLKNGAGPTVLVRTELDALPVAEKTGLPYASKARLTTDSGENVGVMHACGHDLHMTSVVGAAKMLSALKDKWRGTVLLVGQPAEEVGEGTKALLADGLYKRFPRPDFAIAMHADAALEAGKVGWREGYLFANAYAVDVLVRGRGGHGAAPHLAKDPVVLAAQLVLALQTIVSRENSPLDPAVVTIGSIHGGSKGNVIPGDVRLQLSLRSYKTEVYERMVASIKRIAKGLALAAGLPEDLAPVVEVKSGYTPAIYNDPALTRRMAGALAKTLGPDNVVESESVMLADDFARYGLDSRQVPISMFRLGTIASSLAHESRKNGSAPPPLHSAEYAPLPGPSIQTGAKALAAAVLELLGA